MSAKKVQIMRELSLAKPKEHPLGVRDEHYCDTQRKIDQYIEDQNQLTRLKEIIRKEMRSHEISVNQFAGKNRTLQCCCLFCTDARKEELSPLATR